MSSFDDMDLKTEMPFSDDLEAVAKCLNELAERVAQLNMQGTGLQFKVVVMPCSEPDLPMRDNDPCIRDGQCVAWTRDGYRCNRETQSANSDYCWQHPLE